jgi:hypothetical protein
VVTTIKRVRLPALLSHANEAPPSSIQWAFRRTVDLTQPSAGNYCHTARPTKTVPTSNGAQNNKIFPREGCYVTEFDIGEFMIRGEAREIDGEFQAVIVMRAKPKLTTVTYHQVEKDRWFKTADVAAIAAQASAEALKAAVDAGALKA